MNEKKYSLRTPEIHETELIENFKKVSTYAYQTGLSNEERENIASYVNKSVPENLSHYKIIEKDGEVIGCFLAKKEDVTMMLDDLFISENHRGNGIGSSLIKDLEGRHDEIELWVHKDNARAIKLYESLKFETMEETKSKLHMIYKKNKHI